MPVNEKEILKRLRTVLKPSRVRHTLGVADTAVLLAACYGADPEKTKLAALLHDCGKEAGDALGHGPAGAEIAREEYGVEDEEVLSAIRWHTTGKPAMTLLEQIIFTADFIEPSRDGRLPADVLAECRKLAFEDLDAAAVRILECTLEWLKKRKIPVDDRSLKTYDYYIHRVGKDLPERKSE